MDVKIEIDSEELNINEGIKNEGQKDEFKWKMVSQMAYLFLPSEKYPLKTKIKIPVDKSGNESPALKKGFYRLPLTTLVKTNNFEEIVATIPYKQLKPIVENKAAGFKVA